MITRLTLRSTLATMVALSATIAQAQVLYQTGFEAPTYSTTATVSLSIPSNLGGGSFTSLPGSIYYANSQGDPWVVAASPNLNATNFRAASLSSTVQSSTVQAGTQALKIDGAVANQDIFGPVKGLSQTTGGIWDIEFAMRVDNPGTTNIAQWGFGIYNDNQNIAALGFVGGFLGVASGPTIGYSPLTGFFTPVNYSVWNNYRLRLNFVTNMMSVALNGVNVPGFQNLAMRTDVARTGMRPNIILGGQVPFGSSYTSTTEVAFFDNVTVAAAPEPTTLALLSLGGTLVILRRRRQTQRREN